MEEYRIFDVKIHSKSAKAHSDVFNNQDSFKFSD